MRNFHGTFDKRSFISDLSICMTVPLTYLKVSSDSEIVDHQKQMAWQNQQLLKIVLKKIALSLRDKGDIPKGTASHKVT